MHETYFFKIRNKISLSQQNIGSARPLVMWKIGQLLFIIIWQNSAYDNEILSNVYI